jgi:hypothetical protein
VRKTRSERMESLVKQMEEENARIEREQTRLLIKKKQDEFEETMIRLTKTKKGEIINDI